MTSRGSGDGGEAVVGAGVAVVPAAAVDAAVDAAPDADAAFADDVAFVTVGVDGVTGVAVSATFGATNAERGSEPGSASASMPTSTREK